MRILCLGVCLVVGCGTFDGTISVDTSSGTPEFTFEANSGATDYLVVTCIEAEGDDYQADGTETWNIDATAADEYAVKDGGLKSPITYGELPSGARVETEVNSP